ncbi:MAG: glycosyltransferase family 2 protein [Planctomycetota bacterium]
MTTDTTTSAAAPVAPSVPLQPVTDSEYLKRMQTAVDNAEQTLAVADAAAADPVASIAQKLSLSVVIPVYNERRTIVDIVRRVQAAGVADEIIIVDDYSMDGTRTLLLELAKEPGIRVEMHGYNRGKGAALRTGFAHASSDLVMVQDADLEYDPADVPKLLAAFDDQTDVVYGSRFLENAEQDPSWLHRFGNRVLTAASNLTTGQKLTDMETCYKVFRRELIQSLDIEQNRFGFEPEITAKIARRGTLIRELPISYQCRGYDEGKKIGVRDALNAFWCIFKYGVLRR